jgi:hypothetical protein
MGKTRTVPGEYDLYYLPYDASLRVCDFNRLWIWGIVCSRPQPFSTTPALGAPPLLI